MNIVIATKNQGKIEGAKRAFSNYFNDFTIQGIAVASDVREQPVNHEVYLGAKNRVKNLKEYCLNNNISADFYLSIESGITNAMGEWMITNIAVIADNNGFESYASSASFPVPQRFVQAIINTELNQVMNSLFTEDSERHNHGGGIQLLTKNKVTRIDLTQQAFMMALTRYITPEWH